MYRGGVWDGCAKMMQDMHAIGVCGCKVGVWDGCRCEGRGGGVF